MQATLAALARAQQALEGLTNQLLEIGRIEAAADPLTPAAVALAPLLRELARQAGGGRVRVRCPERRRGLDRCGGAAPHRGQPGRQRAQVHAARAACCWPAGAARERLAHRGARQRHRHRAEAQERVFGDFEQVGNAERNLRRGHGLGLAIVRRLALRLGARASRCARRPGAGSVFGLVLPAAPRGCALPAPPRAAGAAHGARAAALRPGLAVLVVEDNAVVADSLVALLRLWSARPHVYAQTRPRRWRWPTCAAIDIALCDIRLPGERDGIALAARAAAAAARRWPIALVSADIDEATLQLARERGWQALRKPVQPAALRLLLQRAQG